MTHGYRILIGACGWLHPEWQERFYPDDLPEDWQLGYYSNEFPVVLLPSGQWQSLQDDADLLEDCNEQLAIVAEVPADYLGLPENEALERINTFITELNILGDHLQAVILSVHKTSNHLESLVGQIKCPVPICLEPAPGADEAITISVQKMCEKNSWPFVWQGEECAEALSQSSLAIGRIRNQDLDMRGLRDVVETMLNKTSQDQTCILLFDGQPPSIETIRNANVILDLF